MQDVKCRLCTGGCAYRFRLRIMHRYDVTYYECTRCGSLQTEEPYWLSEAYKDATRYTDTFIGFRAVVFPPAVYFAAWVLGIETRCRLLDWGGGNGLTARLLRDLGFDAYSFDLYDSPTCAAGFAGTCDEQYDIVTAFEVLEHMAQPAQELTAILKCRPKMFFATTGLYFGEDQTWPYLATYSGRHIFFHTYRGLHAFAAANGYDCAYLNGYVIFVIGKIGRIRRRLLRAGLSNVGQRLVRAWLALNAPQSRMLADWEAMRRKVGDIVN